jgi:uncharacterized protein YecT (DUF1311 family)
MLHIAAGAVLVSMTVAAQAQSGLSSEYETCMERAGTKVVQTGMCAQKEIGSQDGRLNKAYRQVMQQLQSNPTRRMALRDRQRAWLKARDYACDIDGGTFDMNCVVERTAKRADELERMIRF